MMYCEFIDISEYGENYITWDIPQRAVKQSKPILITSWKKAFVQQT